MTTPLRTIIDAAEADLSMDYLEQAIKAACDKGMVQIVDIVSAEMSAKAGKRIMTVMKNIKKQA